jgi:hypothetical protein
MMDLAAQPDPTLPIHLCGEVFSRRGARVEGALETAEGLAARLLGYIVQRIDQGARAAVVAARDALRS